MTNGIKTVKNKCDVTYVHKGHLADIYHTYVHTRICIYYLIDLENILYFHFSLNKFELFDLCVRINTEIG